MIPQYILILYSFVVTILFIAIWIQNNNMFKEILSERQHSQELRQQMLSYLRQSSNIVQALA